jgi:cytochrome c-type protein NapB
MSDHPQAPPEPPLPSKLPSHTVALFQRHAKLVIVFALGFALVGYLRGTRDPGPLPHAQASHREGPGDAPPAVTYAELAHAKIKANAQFKSDLEKLIAQRPGPFEPVVRTDEMKLAALADRARNRAFDGAPPTIPHPVTSTLATSCLSCHQVGLPVGDRIATKVSHPYYANCTQCHVEATRSDTPWTTSTEAANDFQGASRAGPGTRAWPGAPPTIPHSTWMRQDCTSCHGTIARPGLRTTHPWLTSCTQCHAPSAALDQVHFAKERLP